MLALLLVISITSAFSQSKNFKISGVVADSEGLPLESATIHLERVKDSSLVTYTISDKDGKFQLEEKTGDQSLNLFISYVGYKTHVQNVKLTSADIILNTISLQTDANALDEVLIKSRAPITIKKDTLEFNVKSFKTKKDASVEDLLKELPGVEVDEDGKILVNGKEVNKILVNGKPFFGDDPTITTRNLTKDIIEKVQITDTKTKSQAFSGEEGSEDNKTINLTIKEENNKGVFGRVAAGAGTDERYEFAGMFNYFDNDQRLSVLAGGNNTNSPGFSFGEIRKMFGGGYSMSMSNNGSFIIDGRSFGGGQGITVSRNVGANYADELGKEVDLSIDYFHSGSSSDNDTTTERENILPDTRYFTNSTSRSENDSDSHSANIGFDIKVDSTFLININPSFRYTKNENRFRRDESSLDSDNVLTNESSTNSFVKTQGKNFSNEIDITKRFGDKGAYVKFGIENEINSTETDDFVDSETNIFGDAPETIIRDQYSDGEQTLNSVYTNAAYRLPLVAKELFLDFKFGFRNDKRESKRSTFDFDATSEAYDKFNEDLSTDFEYLNRRATPSLKLYYKQEKWSTSLEGSYVFRTLENSDFLRPELSLKRNFEAIEMRANFNYRFSPKASMYSGYSVSNQPPQLSQLRPFQDVSNPLNIVTGNPNLEPSNNHRIYFGFNAFDFQKGTGFNSYISANFRQNQVVSKSTIDEDFVRNTTYVNVDGNSSIFGSASYSKTVKMDSIRKVKLRAGLYSNYRKTVNFNNDVKYASKNHSLTPNVSATFTWKDLFELRPNYRLSFTTSRYDLDVLEDQEFLRHSLGIKTATFLPKKVEWRNDISFNYNPNVADGFQKSVWFWNSTVAYSILKDQGVITLKVYDLLNQNNNTQRIATANYIQDSQSTVLQQYFMLSFSWKFNSLGKKGETGGNDVFFFD